MSVPFEEQCSVWTMNHDPAWLAENAGLPDMRLTYGLSEHAARLLCQRLLRLLPDGEFTIKDNRDRPITTFREARRLNAPADTRPVRRSLGLRDE